MAMKLVPLASILERGFMRVEEDAFPTQSVVSSGSGAYFACDDYDVLLKGIEHADLAAHQTIMAYMQKKFKGVDKLTPEMYVKAITEALIILGGLYKEPYRYTMEGFWKKKTNIGW